MCLSLHPFLKIFVAVEQKRSTDSPKLTCWRFNYCPLVGKYFLSFSFKMLVIIHGLISLG
uniref:Uncharacterized protein n=1 Tax=Manihot esculenta TaxID=3983 RepID=A0A2C9W5N2_MANES